MKNKSRIFSVIYSAAVLCLCAAPFVCMSFAVTDVSYENRSLKEFPALKTEEGYNKSFLSELGGWFENRFAFRNYIVGADGKIQSLFGVSSTEKVIKGSDGWLFYTSTAPDFQRTKVMSDKAAENAANNIRLTQEYAEKHGAKFVFTVAPNKNSLYPSDMPYYYPEGAGEKNIDKLAPLLDKNGVNYADLFALFRSKDEVLYLKQDSHWNNKGAAYAYGEICRAAGREYKDYASSDCVRSKTKAGDLGRMAYSALAAPEWNYEYTLPEYLWTAGGEDVEAAYITTENPEKSGSLLMFRDSFGNTLLPFFASEWGKACFSKAAPYLLEMYMSLHTPDTVVVEKVERNLKDFAENPPVITAPSVSLKATPSGFDAELTLTAAPSAYDVRYMALSGSLPENADADRIFIKINSTVYEAFTVSGSEGDNGFIMYMPKEAFNIGENTPELMFTDSGGLKKATKIIINTEEQ